MLKKCESCIHESVCAYKNKLEAIDDIYIPIKNKVSEYDLFECEIKCKEYRPNYRSNHSTTREVCDEST